MKRFLLALSVLSLLLLPIGCSDGNDVQEEEDYPRPQREIPAP